MDGELTEFIRVTGDHPHVHGSVPVRYSATAGEPDDLIAIPLPVGEVILRRRLPRRHKVSPEGVPLPIYDVVPDPDAE